MLLYWITSIIFLVGVSIKWAILLYLFLFICFDAHSNFSCRMFSFKAFICYFASLWNFFTCLSADCWGIKLENMHKSGSLDRKWLENVQIMVFLNKRAQETISVAPKIKCEPVNRHNAVKITLINTVSNIPLKKEINVHIYTDGWFEKHKLWISGHGSDHSRSPLIRLLPPSPVMDHSSDFGYQ